MDPIYHNFISRWPPHMLIIWLPEKMHRDKRNSKGSTELSATSMQILDSGIYVSETYVCILHIRALAQGTRHSNVNASFPPQPTHLAEATDTYKLAIPLLNQPSRGLYFHKSCSLSHVGL